MPIQSFDVVVVGAGIAGLTAAAMARQQGFDTALVATGPGRFIYGAGWFSADGNKDMDPEALEKAIGLFRQMTDEADCAFAGNLREPQLLPTLMGDFLPVTLAPFTLWNAAPSAGARIAMVGIEGLTGFDENFMAERMQAAASGLGISCVYKARRINISRDLGLPLTPTRLANCFDNDAAFRAELAASLSAVAGDCDRILLPSVLGFQSSGTQLAQFIAAVGTQVGELATLPPSVAAMRVQNRLEHHLRNQGVEFYRGFPVRRLLIENRRCTGLEIDGPGHGTTLHAQRLILAAGSANGALLGTAEFQTDEALHPVASNGALVANNVTLATTTAAAQHCSLAPLLAGFLAGSRMERTEESYAA